MRVDLPGGGWAEIRTSLKAKDQFAVEGAVRLSVASDGGAEVSAGIQTLMRNALLARVLEDWSLEAELPGRHACPGCAGNSALWHQHVTDYLGDVLDLDQYKALQGAVGPLLERVNADPPAPGTSQGSGASS